MALSERFFQQKPKAWDLFAPIVEGPGRPPGFDPSVAEAILLYYREADRDQDAERASAALAHYLYAAHAARRLASGDPERWLDTAYDVVSFFHHVAASLDSIAEWLAAVFDMLLPRGSRPNLAGEEFAARFALVDLEAHGLLKRQRPWLEEVAAYRRLVQTRSAVAWSGSERRIVAASIRVRSSEVAGLGDTGARTVQARPLVGLCEDFLERLGVVLRAMFSSGAGQLGKRKDREAQPPGPAQGPSPFRKS